ncbi:MAG: hypothetical protein ABIO44_08705, partial [Saprospiraceae bacterium]
FALLGITPCPVWYDGIYDEKLIKSLYDEKKDWDKCEGYVVRIADKYTYRDAKHCIAKYVRKNHCQTNVHHWMHAMLVPNKLKDEE